MLSQLLVKKILADSSDYQWVATDEGVFRYDGYELLPLARLVRPGSVAAPKNVSSLVLDAAGHLWIGANEGLFCLTLRTGALRQLPIPYAAGSPPPTVGNLFRHPRSGQLWVSCSGGYTLVLDGRPGGRQLSYRRLPGSCSNFIADGSAAPLALYPNPATVGGSVRVPGCPGSLPVTVLDLAGRRVAVAVADATGVAEVSTNALASGTYVVRTQDGRTTRLVVE